MWNYFFFFFFRYWTGRGVCMASQRAKPQLQLYEHAALLWAASLFPVLLTPVPSQATVWPVPPHLCEAVMRKRFQVQNAHLWSGYFSQVQVLDRVHCATPNAITPTQLKTCDWKQHDFGLQTPALLPNKTLIKLYRIFVLKQFWSKVSEPL